MNLRLPKMLDSGIGVDVRDGSPIFWWEGNGPEPEVVRWLNEDAPSFRTRKEAVGWLQQFLYGSAHMEVSV